MPDLPGGTVTLLFSDVEGSTSLLQRLGERYRAVLEEHHRLLRTAFQAHGGQEVDTQGDSFCIAFARAGDAVAAAMEAQRADLAK
jgi:class 3 adenylate cyclase